MSERPHCIILIEEPSLEIFLGHVLKVAFNDKNIRFEIVNSNGYSKLPQKYEEIRSRVEPIQIILDGDVRYDEKTPDIDKILSHEATETLPSDLEDSYPVWLLVEVVNQWWVEISEETGLPLIEFTREQLYSIKRDGNKMMKEIPKLGASMLKELREDPTRFIWMNKIELAERMGKTAGLYNYVPDAFHRSIHSIYNLSVETAKSRGETLESPDWQIIEPIGIKLDTKCLPYFGNSGILAFKSKPKVQGIKLDDLTHINMSILPKPEVNYEQPVSWSPNGSRLIVFESHRKSTDSKLRYYEVSSGDSVELTPNGVRDELFACWSDDGKYIYTVTWYQSGPRLIRINSDDLKRRLIYKIDGEYPIWMLKERIGYVKKFKEFVKCTLSTGDEETVFSHEHRIKNPAISPNNEWIAFKLESDKDNRIYIYDVVNDTMTPITPYDESCDNPEWVSDSILIYDRARRSDKLRNHNLWIFDLCSGAHNQFTSTLPVTHPKWSK